MKRLVHRVPEGAPPERLDRYLTTITGVSRARIKEAFAQGRVRVDGRAASKGDLVKPGSEIAAEVAEPAREVQPQPELPLRVLFQDPSLVLLDKPAGMPSHPLEEGETGTLANALVARFPECARASPDPRECGLAHRLDVETSGVLMAARTREAHHRLRDLFRRGEIDKRYLALVGGAPGVGGEIAIPIAHHPRNPRRMVACATEQDAQRLKARPALTRYRVLERLGDFALVEATIPTGVMHQIRVHLAAVGAPVCGDPLYGGPSVPGLARQFLHAARLALPHPVTGAPVAAEAPLPADLQAVLESLRAGAGLPPH